MKKEVASGYMFESIIGLLLRHVGYSWSPVNGSGNIKGRGAFHEIDAISFGSYSLPFINNIRLLAEAKYRKSKVSLPVIRNMVGVLLDVNQSYNPDGEHIAKKLLGSRNTNCAVVFSNKSFTRDAINYGYAHNIYLVSYSGNPLMQNVIDKFENLCKYIDFRKSGKGKNQLKSRFLSLISGKSNIEEGSKLLKVNTLHSRQFVETLNEFRNAIRSTSSALGFIEGSYPIHIMSEGNEFYSFISSGIRNPVLEIGYRYKVESNNLVFSFKFDTDKEAYFILPKYIFPRDKVLSGNLIEEKESYLKNIIVPIISRNGVAFMFRLKFNRELIGDLNG